MVSARLFQAALPLLTGGLFIYLGAHVLMLPLVAFSAVVGLVALHVLVLAVMGVRRPVPGGPVSRGTVALFLLGLVLTIPFAFMLASFGTRDVGSLLITIRENRMGDMVAVGLEGFLPEIGRFGLIGGLLFLGGWMMTRFVQLGRPTVLVFALLLIGLGPLTHFIYRNIVPSPAHALIDADEATAGPTILARPGGEARKNLVIVYLESLERVYRDLPETAEAFATLAALEDRGLAFSNLMQAADTGFTAGGMVSTQCGVPLMARGAFNMRVKIRENIDVMPEETDFLLAIPCLGDVLSADGYNLSYINGSNLTIFSKGAFYRSHGYDPVLGFESFPGWQDETRRNVWGMDDDLLFERVTAEIERLAGEDAPFVMTTLTLGTHGPDGYLDATCDAPPQDGSRVPAAIACAGGHVTRLLDTLEELGIAENTLVALMSDHLVFRNTLDDAMLTTTLPRRNLAMVLGAGQGVIDRPGSMLDIYPTLLDLLGYTLDGDRAGLGRSLLGQTPTLVEDHGIETLNEAIQYNSALQEALWAAPENGPDS